MVIIFWGIELMAKWIYKIKLKMRIGEYIILFWSVFSKILLMTLKAILVILPLGLIEMYVAKLDMELKFNMAFDYRIIIPELIQVILITFIMFKIIKSKKGFDKKIYFFYYLGFFIIGSIMLFSIFTRTRFVFAYFLPFILGINNELEKSQKDKKIIAIVENSLLTISLYINIYYIYFMYCNGVFI